MVRVTIFLVTSTLLMTGCVDQPGPVNPVLPKDVTLRITNQDQADSAFTVYISLVNASRTVVWQDTWEIPPGTSRDHRTVFGIAAQYTVETKYDWPKGVLGGSPKTEYEHPIDLTSRCKEDPALLFSASHRWTHDSLGGGSYQGSGGGGWECISDDEWAGS